MLHAHNSVRKRQLNRAIALQWYVLDLNRKFLDVQAATQQARLAKWS